MIHLSTSLKHYKREDVQKAILEHAKDKEVAARFNEQFGKRPDTLTYPSDVLELAKQGATSFHCSEELWTNPLLLRPQMEKKELDHLRKGWDLLLDVDCEFLEYSKIAAELIVMELKKHGVNGVTIKFSGNKGFHIAMPFETFPESVRGKLTRELFPEAPKKIAAYIREQIKGELGTRILALEGDNLNTVAIKTGKNLSEIVEEPLETLERKQEVLLNKFKNAEDSESRETLKRKIDDLKKKAFEKRKYGDNAKEKTGLNAEPFLVIDTLLISSRHMYRMPYSMHEKSGLVSVPIDSSKIMKFSKDQAVAEKVKVGDHLFMDRSDARQNEAEKLFIAAYDFGKMQTTEAKKLESKSIGAFEEIEGKIPQQYFPPCIKKILEGVEDGRKRALFVLINFLGSCNYGYEEIEAMVKDWNNRNKEPLPHLYISSQLSYNRQKSGKALPPNCSNVGYYKELGIECTPECGRCSNPVAEAKYIYRRAIRVAESQKPPKKNK